MAKGASWRDQKESTSTLGINILMFMYRFCGRKSAFLVIWLITFGVVLFNKRVRSVCLAYYKNLSDYANTKGKTLPKYSVHKHIYTFAKSILIRVLTWKEWVKQPDLVAFKDLDKLNFLLKRNQGSVIFGSHIGSIDTLRALNNQSYKCPVNILIWTKNSQKLETYLGEINKNSNVKMFITQEVNPSLGVMLKEAIDKHENIVILADRLSDENSRKVKVNFLGMPASFPQGPWILANVLKAPILTLHFINSNGKNSFVCKDWGVINIPRLNREKAIQEYAQKYAYELEDLVINSPCEWFNFYDFWQE